MPIDFTPTEEQKQLVNDIRALADACFAPARKAYSKCRTPMERYQACKPFYEDAVKRGLLLKLIPKTVGGESGSLIDLAFLCEELHAADANMSVNLLSNGLGLLPIITGATKEQQEKYLKPFLQKEGTPSAATCLSEPTGTANWHLEGGLKSRAVLQGDEYVLSGEKIWPTHCAGWDGRGPTVSNVICRIQNGNSSQCGILIVTREDIDRNPEEAFQVVRDVPPMGHEATSGPHIKYTNLRVPKSQLLGGVEMVGEACLKMVEQCFTTTALFVGAFSVGIMRAAFEPALKFAQQETRGGPHPIIEHQTVADLLIDCKAKIEASRYLVWKGCHAWETSGDAELAFIAKIYCGDIAPEVVIKATRAVGMASYDGDLPYGHLLAEAACMSLFDGGNHGVRRRQLGKLFSSSSYDPRKTLGL